jgi:methylmalonyl-CoA mutase cobalamin-binding subunit
LKTVVAGALGECVHVAGISNFLRLARKAGWKTIFLGPAVSIEKIIDVAKAEQADLVGVSYRLTPENGQRLVAEFAEAADHLLARGTRFVFGGTPPVVDAVEKIGFFEKCFDGHETQSQVLEYLQESKNKIQGYVMPPQTTIERILRKRPFPIIRHHFGLPSLKETVDGIEKISNANILDVISLGTDQDAQENYFKPQKQSPRRVGAGGVPVRTKADFEALYQSTRTGNYPLMRTYSGSDDFIQLAELYVETINIAWAAIPLFWFNQMDGRGPWDLEGSISEHQNLMKWYGDRNIPVEVNEPHHWGMRDAPDVVYVAAAYLSAYNAKFYGVKDYIAQFMFNSPPNISDAMDLAKMLAILELIDELKSDDFRIWKQTRTGLLSYPVDPDFSRAHLASSVYLQMALKPDIVHVVGYVEADHAATAEDIIESCKLANRAIENALAGQPNPCYDPEVQRRKEELISEVKYTISAIRKLSDGSEDALRDSKILAEAVTSGILDAPQLTNNPYAKGKIQTFVDYRGACLTMRDDVEEAMSEKERLATFL